MKRRNMIIIAIIGILFVALITGIVLSKVVDKKENDGNDDTIVKENVQVITDTTEPEKQPIEVTEDELVFVDDPHYSPDDIIAAGIITAAPEGFLRRVLGVEKSGGHYVVKTEYAVLTDVFEELHLTKNFVLTPDGVDEADGNSMSRIGAPGGLQRVSYREEEASPQNGRPSEMTRFVSAEENTDYQFYKEFEEEMEDGISLSGFVGFHTWEEIKFDISHGDIVFGMALHNEADGELSVEWSEGAEAEYQQEIWKKELPVYQFMVSGIPIVITTELLIDINGNVEAQGSLGTSFGLKSENISGFLYDSKTGRVEDVSERNYLSDGLDWKTEAKVSGSCRAGVLLHLVSKLYDCTGADIAAGISGGAEGEVSVSTEKSVDGINYAGYIEMSVNPELQGGLIVTVPVIDETLAEKTLFQLDLKPFWEKHWESSGNWRMDLANADAGGNAGLNHTYQTKFGDVNMVTYPSFVFDYPDGWTISREEVTQTGETVILTNARGIEITYTHISGVREGELGGGSAVNMARVEAGKIADSQFVPSGVQGTDHSGLGKFMVARLKVTGQLDMMLDTDFRDVDGAVSYAVLPESRQGIDDNVRYPNTVQSAFWYSSYISFIAESPDGRFSENEEKEVIEILSSFRTES